MAFKIIELYREEARKKEQAPRQKAHDARLKAQEAKQLLQQRFAEIALQQAARQAAQEQQRTQATFWQCLDGPTFEREVAKLFEQAGYRAELTPVSGDEGIDILLYKDGRKLVVQCKAQQKPVGPSIVRDLYGTMHHAKAQAAILVSLGGFTVGVHNFACGKPIELMDLDAVLRLQQLKSYTFNLGA